MVGRQPKYLAEDISFPFVAGQKFYVTRNCDDAPPTEGGRKGLSSTVSSRLVQRMRPTPVAAAMAVRFACRSH